MSDLWRKYVEDPRIICKYGIKCYQKSPQHHAEYKHPPSKGKRKADPKPHAAKRLKVDDSDKISTHADQEVKNVEKSIKEIKPSSPEKVSPRKDVIRSAEDITYFDGTVDEDKIEELFLVKMPLDFYKFYKCLREEENWEKLLSSVNLQLIGPFELLMGKLPIVEDKDLYLVHWRFFYDPPEFQSVLKRKGKSEYHIGYFRDNPDEAPVFLGSNNSSKDCTITPIADNIFGAVIAYLQNERKLSPFSFMDCQKFMDKVKVWAEKENISLNAYDIKQRLQKICTRSLHGAGIVVPYNKKTKLGYRNLVENDATLKKIFKKIENSANEDEKDKALAELQPVITYASIGVDECDFGVGLEMGLDLFVSGLKELEQSAVSLLCSSYPLLKRDNFFKILQVHIKHRRKGPEMSLLNIIQE